MTLNRFFCSGGVLTLNRYCLRLQLYFEATGNVLHCPILSKLKLGLELKQKFAPKLLFLNNSKPTLVLVLNHNFEGWEISNTSVVSVFKMVGSDFRVGWGKIVSQNRINYLLPVPGKCWNAKKRQVSVDLYRFHPRA